MVNAKRDDCGPAFPSLRATDGFHDTLPGMSLRDWFAGQALMGMGTWMPDYDSRGERVGGVHHLSNRPILEARAKWAYDQADAMLAERERS